MKTTSGWYSHIFSADNSVINFLLIPMEQFSWTIAEINNEAGLIEVQYIQCLSERFHVWDAETITATANISAIN